MQIESRSVIYDAAAQPESDRVAFFDSVLRLESGIWLSGFTAGRTKHHHLATIRLCRSRDNGQTWELLGWRFSADRMVTDYVLKSYIPAAGGTSSEMRS